MQEDDITQQLKEAMLRPKKVEIDGKTVEQHNLQDVIAMDKYAESKQALKRSGCGIRFTKMQASGAV